MANEINIFKNLKWNDKIEYMNKFYQAMIKKTDNPEYINKFQSKIDEVNAYEENELNNKKLVSLYERVIWAKQKTKQKKTIELNRSIKKNKQKLANIKSKSNEQDPDEYLAEALANI